MDEGYYGRGIYFTRHVHSVMKYGNKVTVSMVIPGNVFPVVEHPFTHKRSQKGKGPQKGHQSHYTIGTFSFYFGCIFVCLIPEFS